jgi:hypothetical protein
MQVRPPATWRADTSDQGSPIRARLLDTLGPEMENANGPSPRSAVRTAAFSLSVDSVTAEVVTAMRGAAIRMLLLKGPSIAAWLYEVDAARAYVDSDLLVPPESYGDAGAVLRELGFRPLDYSWHRDSQTWVRADSSPVDLHRSLIGAFAPPEVVWHELAAKPDTLNLGGIDVEVLRIPARALHVALHAAQHGLDAPHPREDLARALRFADEQAWREAADLARRINALPAFAAGLRLDPEGARLANRMGLPAVPPAHVALLAGHTAPVSIALESLVNERNVRARAHLLFKALVPPPVYMRQWSVLHMPRWPEAVRQGPLGVGLAYLWRPIWILVRVPKAIAALRRARRGQTSVQ